MQKISYYELRLRNFLSENHPLKKDDTEFIENRSCTASLLFEESSKSGMSVEESLDSALQHLFHGLLFSPYLMIKEIAEREFSSYTFSETEILNVLASCEKIFDSYDLSDDFAGSKEYVQLYNELVGYIQMNFGNGI